MYEQQIQSEFTSLFTRATGQVGVSAPFIPELAATVLAARLAPAATDLAKAERAGDFGLVFRDPVQFPFFAVTLDFLRSLLEPVIKFLGSVGWRVFGALHGDELAEHLEAAGKTTKTSVVALLLRFASWAVRTATKWLRVIIGGKASEPTPTEAKIQALLAEVNTYCGPTGFGYMPFRALIASLAGEGRPFSMILTLDHLQSQINLYQQEIAARGLSIAALAKLSKVSSSTLRKLLGTNPSTGVTAGTLARVSAALNVPLLGVRPAREAPDATDAVPPGVEATDAVPPGVEATDAEAPGVEANDGDASDPTVVEFRHSSTLRAEQDQRLTMRAREFVETTCIFDSDTACKLDCDDLQTILAVLRNIRREKVVNDDLGIEDAQKSKLARHLWLVFRCDTGIDTSLNVRAIERLLPEVDTVFEKLQHVDAARIEVRNFVGSHNLESSISRSRFARITGVDTTGWPAAISAPRIVRNAGVDKLIKFDTTPCPVSVDREESRNDITSELFRVVEARTESAGAESKVAESAVLAQVQQLQEELASLTAKVNSRLTH